MAGGAAMTNISQPGKLFSELSQVATNKPDLFKSLASKLATSFHDAADKASGQDAKVLGALADQFREAAKTGQLQPSQGAAQVAPSGAAHGHAHHRHHGGGAGAASSAVQSAMQSAIRLVDDALKGAATTASAVGSSTSTV